MCLFTANVCRWHKDVQGKKSSWVKHVIYKNITTVRREPRHVSAVFEDDAALGFKALGKKNRSHL